MIATQPPSTLLHSPIIKIENAPITNAANIFALKSIRQVNAEVSNLSFHDLTPPSFSIPVSFRRILGLNLAFCPTPSLQRHSLQFQSLFPKFQRDLRLKYQFRKKTDRSYERRLYIRNTDFTPEPASHQLEDLIETVRLNIKNSVSLIHQKQKQKQKYNLSPHQRRLIKKIAFLPDIKISLSDKNLGPCILTVQQYHELCYKHINSPSYTQVEQSRESICALLRHKARSFFQSLPSREKKNGKIIHFDIRRKTLNKFYGLIKLHKKELAIRPIVSNANAILSGLSVYLDVLLQPFFKKLDSYIKDSDDFLSQLKSVSSFPQGCIIGTADVVSMYTNINTSHAIDLISQLTSTHPLTDHITQGLSIIMNNNYFSFDGKIFHQTNGTAMGTSVAPSFASLFLGIIEQKQKIHTQMLFYKRFIDDIFFIFDPSKPPFKSIYDVFDEIKQESGLSFTFNLYDKHPISFLDLSLTFNRSQFLVRTNIKDLNLFLYIPFSSAHPPGILKSIVFGRIKKYKTQNSSPHDFKYFVTQLYTNLLRRGYPPHVLKPIFHQAWNAIHNNHPQRPPTIVSNTPQHKLFVHVPYNPNALSHKQLREIFCVPSFKRLGLDVVIAYKRPPNLASALIRN